MRARKVSLAQKAPSLSGESPLLLLLLHRVGRSGFLERSVGGIRAAALPSVGPVGSFSKPLLSSLPTPAAVDFVRSSRPYRSTEQSVPFSLSTLSGLFFSPLPLSCSSLLLWPSLPSPLVCVRPLRRSSCCCCRVSSFSRSWDGGRRRRRCGIFSMHASYL